jgi:hypothetical protein
VLNGFEAVLASYTFSSSLRRGESNSRKLRDSSAEVPSGIILAESSESTKIRQPNITRLCT